MKLVKSPQDGVCEAQRCKATEGLAIVEIDDRNAQLCPRHAERAGEVQAPAPAAPRHVPEHIRTKVQQDREYLERVKAACERLDLSNPQHYELAESTLKFVKGKLKDVEAERTAITKPINDSVKRINDLFRPVKTFCQSFERELKNKISDHLKAAEAQQDQALMAGATDDDIVSTAHGELLPETGEGVSATTVFRWRVKDETAIPRDLMRPNDELISALVKQRKEQALPGKEKEIPGIEVYTDKQLRVRS